MNNNILDARGLSCPQPVMLVNRAIKEGLKNFEVLVSSEVSKENVIRAAAKAGYSSDAKEEGEAIRICFFKMILKGGVMKYEARNDLKAVVKSVKKGDIMSIVKFDLTELSEMASVLTTESVEALELKPDDNVELVIKAIHVLPVKA